MTSKQRVAWGLVVWSIIATCFCGFLWRAKLLTEREKQEAVSRATALDERDAAVMALIHAHHHGFAVLNSEGNVTEWNRALEEWTDIPLKDIRGKPISSLMNPEEGARHREAYKEAIEEELSGKGSSVKVVQCTLTAKSGERIPVIVHVYVVRGKYGEPYAVALVDRRENVKEVVGR